MEVQVAYALPDRQLVLELQVPPGTTVGEALRRSRIWERFPEIDPERAPVGVYGRHRGRDEALHDGDRVEVYRPLAADPKRMRRQRAEAQRPGR